MAASQGSPNDEGHTWKTQRDKERTKRIKDGNRSLIVRYKNAQKETHGKH